MIKNLILAIAVVLGAIAAFVILMCLLDLLLSYVKHRKEIWEVEDENN